MTFWADRPQTIAVASDAFIFLSAGMNFALGLGYTPIGVTNHYQCSWFIGVIIGVLLAAPLTKILTKRYYVLLSSLLVVVGGIVYTALPLDLVAILAARYLNGIGTGFITVPFIVHCSEISVMTRRGLSLGLEQLFTALGILIQVIYFELFSGSNGTFIERIPGIICLSFGLNAFGLSFFIIESPVFHIRRANDDEACNSLTRLQLPAEPSDQKTIIFDEHKNYVLANEHFGKSQSLSRGWGPLLKMVIYQSVMPFTFSLPYHQELILGTIYDITTGYLWTTIVYTALRILGVLTALSLLDSISRKILSLVGLLVMAVLGVLITVIFADLYNWPNAYQMSLASVLLLIIQYFAGLYAPTSTVYLGEAFPMVLKPYFIALCICVQCVVHIIIMSTFDMNQNSVFVFNTFSCIYLFACFVFFLFTIPETRFTTLAEAQEKFCNWYHLKFW